MSRQNPPDDPATHTAAAWLIEFAIRHGGGGPGVPVKQALYRDAIADKGWAAEHFAEALSFTQRAGWIQPCGSYDFVITEEGQRLSAAYFRTLAK